MGKNFKIMRRSHEQGSKSERRGGGSNAALQNVAVFGECGDVRNGDARLMVFGGHGWTNWESV